MNDAHEGFAPQPSLIWVPSGPFGEAVSRAEEAALAICFVELEQVAADELQRAKRVR
jgi:hypothetical protein